MGSAGVGAVPVPAWKAGAHPVLPAPCVPGCRVPTSIKDHVGLTARPLLPASQLVALEEKELNLLKQQIPGWKVRWAAVQALQCRARGPRSKNGACLPWALQVVESQAGRSLRYEWRARSPEAATQLQVRLRIGRTPEHSSDGGGGSDVSVAVVDRPHTRA